MLVFHKEDFLGEFLDREDVIDEMYISTDTIESLAAIYEEIILLNSDWNDKERLQVVNDEVFDLLYSLTKTLESQMEKSVGIA